MARRGLRRHAARRRAAAAGAALALAAGVFVAAQVLAAPGAAATSYAATIAAGYNHSCMILSGKAYCWGDNTYGELGNGTTVSSTAPVAVSTAGGLSGVTLTAITAGYDFTCALSSAGAVYCWGYNNYGQLGNNSTASSKVPVAVSTAGVLSGVSVTQISAGYGFVCAVGGSAAYCWGSGGNGELGNAGTGNSSVPVAVSTAGVLSGVSVTQVVATPISACAIGGGAAYCWGYGSSGQLGNGTTPNTQSTRGAVTASGTPMSGATLTGITGGNNFMCALSSAGAAYCWGGGGNGQLGNNSYANSSVPVAVSTSGVLSGVTVTQIESGQDATCALSSTAAYCWGRNTYGQLGNNSTTQSAAPVAVSTSGVLSGVTLTQISGGASFTCAVSSTAAYCWGTNASGQLANSATSAAFTTPVAVTFQPTTIAAGFDHSCMLRQGKAWCWGDNTNGELGNYTTISSNVPVAVDTSGALSGVTLTRIVVGQNFTCALSSAGAVYCWGLDNYGQLGSNSTADSHVPVAVSTAGVLSGVTVTDIAAGGGFACALSSAGAAYCWGNNFYGQLGNNGTTGSGAYSSVPVAVSTSGVLSGVVLTQLAAPPTGTTPGAAVCGLSTAGTVYCWGLNNHGQLGNNNTGTNSSVPVAVTTSGVLSGVVLTDVSVGYSQACAVSAAGVPYCWGGAGNNQLGNNSTTDSGVPVAVTTSGALSGVTLTQLSSGGGQTCALSTAGAAYCWGQNNDGQVGNGNTGTNAATPAAVTTSGVLSGITLAQVAAGNYHTCALDTTGATYCWGNNSSGQLGNPVTANNFNTAVAVTSQATMISAGYVDACAVRNGNGYCWGDNTDGQLGNNSTTTQFNTEVAVSAPSGGAVTWSQISAGDYGTCGLTTAGAAYCWGQDNVGQVGNGTSGSTNYLIPTAVSAPSGGAVTWSQISVGAGQVCAITTSGAGYCWGNGASGDLGDGSTSNVSIPTAMSAPSGGAVTWTQIATAGAKSESCGLASTGAAYCWGVNGSGQLGDGNTSSQFTPTPVSTASTPMAGVTIVQVSVGYDFACALGANGDAYCWGDQTDGELGNGVTNSSIDALVPVAVITSGVLSGATLTQIAAGGASGPRQACALSSAGLAYCWGSGTNGNLGNNATSQSNVPVAVYTSGVLSGMYLTQISEGLNYACTRASTGTFYCWGGNNTGDLGDNATSQSNVPVQVLSLAAGTPATVTAFPAATSAVVYWADPASTGTGTFTDYVATASPGGATCSASTVTATTCTITGLTTGTTYTVTMVTYTSDGQSPVSNTATVTPWPPNTSIASGQTHACVLSAGLAYCWGDNTDGQLGNNSTTASATPVAVSASGALSGLTLTQISTGQHETCALSSAGAAYCWGLGTSGQLGNGASSSVLVPAAVSAPSAGAVTWAQISVGGTHVCALTTAGAAYCWGAGANGDLGDGSSSNVSIPTAVSAPSGGAVTWVQISAAEASLASCAVATTGAGYCWGSNSNGQIGNGNTSNTSVPTAVSTSGLLSGVALSQISAGYDFACALSAAGAAYCWGLQSEGELGNNVSSGNATSPVAVSTSGVLSGVTLTQITSGGGPTIQHACALGSTGAAYCWGSDGSGQLGNSSTTQSNVPVTVTTSGTPISGATIVAASAGGNFTCALDTNSTAYCWGDNTYGEDGNDSAVATSVAVYVGPQAPVSVTATPGNGSAAISWTAPAYLNNGTITGYTATATGSPGTASCSTSGATGCTITGLIDGISYTITVTATATPNGSSAPSTSTSTIPVGLEMGAPASLTWATTETGISQNTVDGVSGDQQISVYDSTGSGAGWNITMSETTLTAGTHTLPNTNATDITGSTTSSVATTAPTATCVTSCTLPVNTSTYPVFVSTAASSPSLYTIYDTSAGSGMGVITLGGSTSASPFGWWLYVPGSAYAGSYTSTITLTLSTGP
jgi:alpha-tubulin suppressor-like RCC1 family protein